MRDAELSLLLRHYLGFKFEWSLTLFGLLSQLAVGILLMLFISSIISLQYSAVLVLYIVFLLTLLAGTASVFHLTIIQAPYRVFFNQKYSWLARNFLSFIAFLVMLAAYIFKVQLQGFPTYSALEFFVAFIGFITIILNAMVYSQFRFRQSMRYGNPIFTSFFSTFLLGSLGLGFIYSLFNLLNPLKLSLEFYWLIILVGLMTVVLQLCFFSILLRLLNKNTEGKISRKTLLRKKLFLIKMVISIVLIGLLTYMLVALSQKTIDLPSLGLSTFIAFILAVAGEVVWKYLFYLSMSPPLNLIRLLEFLETSK